MQTMDTPEIGTFEYHYAVDPATLVGMEYRQGLEWLIHCCNELLRTLNNEERTVLDYEKNCRISAVYRRRELLEGLLDETN